MLVPVGLGAVLVHAGAVPLPGRVEIRDQHVAAQVAGVLGVATGAVPVVGPERRLVELGVVGFGRQGLPEPVQTPAAVGTREDHEIAQDPKRGAGFPRGRWLDVAVAAALIAAAVLAVMTGRGGRPAAAPAAGPGIAASPALLPSTVRARIPVPFGQPGGMTVLGST